MDMQKRRTLRVMKTFGFATATAAIMALALGACSQYGLRGDKGLPPPPERMAYPNINEVPADGRAARSPAEQDALKARLLAAKPRVARSPKPFNPAKGVD